MFILISKSLILSPPPSGSKSVSNPVAAIFKDSLGIHFTLTSLLQGVLSNRKKN